MDIREYEAKAGVNPVCEWFAGLDAQAAAGMTRPRMLLTRSWKETVKAR
jgi:hypothetical protein